MSRWSLLRIISPPLYNFEGVFLFGEMGGEGGWVGRGRGAPRDHPSIDRPLIASTIFFNVNMKKIVIGFHVNLT